MIEVRSYRRVFELERRIYRIDRLRLNPGGVPLRGLVYLAATAVMVAVASRAPVVGAPLSVLPWYLRFIALPGATAALLGALRIDGRPFHLVAVAIVAGRRGPRAHALRRLDGASRWSPPPLLYLPDGSEPTLRRLRYSGPGATRMLRDDKLAPVQRAGLALRRCQLVLTERAGARPAGSLRVLELDRGCKLETRPAGAGRRGGRARPTGAHTGGGGVGWRRR